MPSASAHATREAAQWFGTVGREADFAGRLNGFTLLLEAFILMLARQMAFAAVARIVGESAHRVLAVCQKYVEVACGLADYSDVTALGIDETSRARGHSYVTLAADADARRVLFVTEGRDAKTIEQLAEYLGHHGCSPESITSASIDMSPAFIAGVTQHLPNARVTNDQIPRHRPRQHGGAQDAPHRAAHRQVPQRHALDSAQGYGQAQA